MATRGHAALLASACALILASSAAAQNAQPIQPAAPPPPPASDPRPTAKDRLDQAVSAVTLDPMRHANVDMKHVIDTLGELNPQPIETLSAEDARKQPTPTDAVKRILEKEGKPTGPEGGVTTKDLNYEGAGGKLAARVYRPDAKITGPMPVIVYYHGGGWVLADIDTYDATPRAIAKQAAAIVVSAEYRHAPENKFPAAHDDAVAAYKWALANAKDWGGDPKKIAVMGESAGGNLAIGVAMAARDQKLPMPQAQILIYPVAQISMDTDSYKANANAKPLNKPMMAWFFDKTLKSDADKNDPRIDLVGKADLKGLPATTIITAGIDPLHDDGVQLGEKLKGAGVPVVWKDYPGATHEFFGMAAVVKDARDAQSFVVQQLNSAFGSDDTTGSVNSINKSAQ